jgi:hypothetical protein
MLLLLNPPALNKYAGLYNGAAESLDEHYCQTAEITDLCSENYKVKVFLEYLPIQNCMMEL